MKLKTLLSLIILFSPMYILVDKVLNDSSETHMCTEAYTKSGERDHLFVGVDSLVNHCEELTSQEGWESKLPVLSQKALESLKK